MPTWLVTGGAGFIGANFVRLCLAESDAQLVVLDKLTYAGNLQSLADVADNPRFHFVQGDIADRPAVEAIFHQHAPSALLNFAAETHVDRSIDGPQAFIQTNVMGTLQLLEVARAHFGQLAESQAEDFRFLHISTDEVYGSLGVTGAFSETTPYSPNSPYSASKAGADHLVHAYHETFGLPTLITNCSNNYGPYQFPEKLIPLMILNALERGRVGEKYNLGGDNERANLEIVDGICTELEKLQPAAENSAMTCQSKSDYSDLKTHVTDRPGHDRRYAIDASKVRDELGWRPRYDLASGLSRTVRWYLENRVWWEAIQSGSYQRERLGIIAP